MKINTQKEHLDAFLILTTNPFLLHVGQHSEQWKKYLFAFLSIENFSIFDIDFYRFDLPHPPELSNSVFITFHSLEPIIWMHFFAHEQIIDLSGVLLDLSETICRRSEWITLESATQTSNLQKKKND